MDLMEDGYLGDVIGEATPDVLVNEFVSSSSIHGQRISNITLE